MGNVVSLGLIMIPITAVFLYRIQLEEAALAHGLGDPYRSYMLRTKRLLPHLY
jgi:protein-S-isoprenylcysteine O-methyltransferase